jgi:hypothetical protein
VSENNENQSPFTPSLSSRLHAAGSLIMVLLVLLLLLQQLISHLSPGIGPAPFYRPGCGFISRVYLVDAERGNRGDQAADRGWKRFMKT